MMRETTTYLQVCLLLIGMLVSSIGLSQTDSTYSLEYLTDTLVLGAHPLSSQFKLKHNSIYISRKSKELAATFDDPSRVLYRHVGISTANDQANGIIYHGLPSDFTKWTIHGAEIVNPNHTSNAGTFDDISSQSAGGVLGIPFDVINNFSFHANTHIENTPTAIGGVANFNFLSKSENFFKIGLLGLELGLQSKKSKIPIKTHLRYSTVGLIGQLGVDFGGEKIAFTDGFFQAGLSPHIDFISGGGFSSNIFQGVENIEEAESSKELTNVDFNSYFLYSGFLFDKKRHKHSLIYSRKLDTRTATSDFFSVFPRAEFENNMISYAGQVPIFEQDLDHFDLLINSSFSDVNHSFPNSKSDEWRSYMTFALRYIWFNDKYSVSAKVGPQIEFANMEITPEVSFIAKRQFNASSLELSSSLSSQEQSPLLYGLEDRENISGGSYLLRNKSFNLAVSYKAEFVKDQNWMFRTFYQLLTDVPIDEYGFSPILQVPYNGIETDNLRFNSFGAAINYGIELMYDQQFRNGFYLNANVTWFELIQDGANIEVFGSGVNLAEGLDPTNNFKYIANVNFSKSWKIQRMRSLSANVAFHLRGGAYDYFDYQSPVQLRPYQRIDARVQYDFKKSILSLDIQNLLNQKNDAFYFYDELLQERVLKQQLGLIPVLSWKRKF